MSVSASTTASRADLARGFASVLAYPEATPAPAARALASTLESGEAAELLEAFAALAEDVSLGELQEEYTRAFDLDLAGRGEPPCYLEIGHYLFEETHKRGAFIVELRKRFRAIGFDDPSELADHLVVLLRFLAVCDDEELSDELVEDALLPALSRMALLAGSSDASTPGRAAYLGVIRALALALGGPSALEPPRSPEREAEREWLREGDSLGIERAWC